MEDVSQILVPSASIQSSAILVSLLIFVLISTQILFNIWRSYKTSRDQKKQADDLKKNMQDSEKRIRELFLQMESNRKTLLEDLNSVTGKLSELRDANEFQNQQGMQLLEDLQKADAEHQQNNNQDS